MAKVNYIRECRAFIAIASEERFTANEFVLWHALFELFNRKANNDEWPDGFIPVSNARLLALTTFGVGDSGPRGYTPSLRNSRIPSFAELSRHALLLIGLSFCLLPPLAAALLRPLRKARERLQARGLIRYRKGRRGALTPEYCLCYFFAEKSEPADNVKTSEITRPQGSSMGRRTGKLLGRPLGKPLDIPLNVNLNVNPNPGQKKLKSSGTNPRAKAIAANRQTDDAVSIQALQTSAAAYNGAWKTSARDGGQRRASPTGQNITAVCDG